MTGPASRRAVITGALAAAALSAAPAAPLPPTSAKRPVDTSAKPLVDNAFWTSLSDWRSGTGKGTRAVPGTRPGLEIGEPAGLTRYADPHTGRTAAWESATWTSPVRRSRVPATEVILHWNAVTPAGTWLQVELSGHYSDGKRTPWYVMARWASGDTAADIRRTSVDRQSDGRSSVRTDTLTVDAPATGLRIAAYQLRLVLHREQGSRLTPVVHRVGAMASDLPNRFTVPASAPGLARELPVPRYSQEIHAGQYPEYDNGGEAWCSPTSSQMVIEYWGRKPSPADLAWVNPAFADPQVCHAARFTYDHQYQGCGNWPFNAAYAATYPSMSAAVTRLGSLTEAEALIGAGIPVITSQAFLEKELTGSGYGTPGHLMVLVGFTAGGDVITHDPASPSDSAVRRVYPRRAWERIWLRTRRNSASGSVVSGSGGVCYLYWPSDPSRDQLRVLRSLGLL